MSNPCCFRRDRLGQFGEITSHFETMAVITDDVIKGVMARNETQWAFK